MTQDVRDLAQETWGAAVLNAYGATEANLIGIECQWTTGLHVLEDLLVLEVVDENDQPVPPGVAGHKLLVTTLFNRTLPFIRYELSDLVTVASGHCRCGRTHLRLASVQGRREDVLSLPALVLRDAATSGEVLRSARRVIAAELDHIGAAVEALTVKVVGEIGRAGTGAKEKLVSMAA